ncbi:MAG: hypothetical protein QOE51_1091 [Actinoplanes sp.]|jgi:hypothetical protein|nr:hypothetical protein [Actinoplanes sp.]
MSQPPNPPYGQPEPNQGGYQPPYPPAQPTSGGSYPGGGYDPGSQQGYPPQSAGGYPPPAGQQPYGAPGAEQPYGAPPAGQQPYGAPPAGQQPYSAPPAGQPPYGAPPKKKGGALKVVLIVVGVVLLLCIGGGVLLVVQGKKKVEDVVAAARISVIEPTTLGGRDKVSDPQLAGSVQSLDSQMKNIKGTTSSVGAIYGDLQKQDLVMIAAASTLTGSQQSRFDEFTRGLSSGGFSTTSLTDTNPGPLGGLAKCGDSSAAGVPTAVCVWSDRGSVGMVAMLFKKKADLEKEFVSMRSEIEQKA